MTQDEQWKEVISFMEVNKQRPSKFVDEECSLKNWWKHQQKVLNAEGLKEDRIGLFSELLELREKYKHKNQYE